MRTTLAATAQSKVDTSSSTQHGINKLTQFPKYRAYVVNIYLFSVIQVTEDSRLSMPMPIEIW